MRFFEVRGTFLGRLFSATGNYKHDKSLTPLKEIFYIPEDSIFRLVERNQTLILKSAVGLDFYKLSPEEFENLKEKLVIME